MKTKFKITVITVAVISFTLLQKKTSEGNDIALVNVEALANWEGNGNPLCFLSGSVDCPANNVKVYKVLQY
jgi:hypothetical protein